MSVEWKNETSYSSSDKLRIPHTWGLVVPELGRVVVTRKSYDPDSWYLFCPGLRIDDYKLTSHSIEEAQDEAVGIIFKKLKRIMSSMETLFND